ncbi:MAG: 4Fe-4S binding protein [Acidobacteriota bacterium]
MVQGAGAAGGVVALGEMVIMDPITSVINDELCSGCKVCVSVCPYDAITFDAEKKISHVEEVTCKGCGACVAACPSGAAHQNFYLDSQITAEINGALL